MSAMPAPDDSLYDQLIGLARLVEGEGEIAARPGQLDRLDAIGNRLRALAGLEYEKNRAPVDWPARSRKAADVAGSEGHNDAYGNLMRVSYWLEQAPPHVVEAIGRALAEDPS